MTMTTSKPTTKTKCSRCSSPTISTHELCIPCSVELEYAVSDAEPDPESLTCCQCGQSYRFSEARVLRYAKNPSRGNDETPHLCWVCTRLHYSAHDVREVAIPSF